MDRGRESVKTSQSRQTCEQRPGHPVGARADGHHGASTAKVAGSDEHEGAQGSRLQGKGPGQHQPDKQEAVVEMSTAASNKEQVLAQLKKDLRSLLVSSKYGLDANQLMRDYGNMLGYPIPLQLLGFQNILDMATAMPDVMSVTYGINGCRVFKAVSDKSTMHIEQLVAKQRSKKKKSTVHHQPAPIWYHQGQNVFLSLDTFRAQLRILLSQGPLKLCSFNCSYKRCFGHPVKPHNFGFNTLKDLLEAVQDLIFIQPTNMSYIVCLRDNVVSMNHTGLYFTPNWVKTKATKGSHSSGIPTRGKPSEPLTCLPAATEKKDGEADPDRDQKLPLEKPSGKNGPLIENSHLTVQPAEGDKGRCTVVVNCDADQRVDSSQVGNVGHPVTNAHEEISSPWEGKIMAEYDRCSTEAHREETSEDSQIPEEIAEKSIEVCSHHAEIRDVTQDVALDVLCCERLKRPTQRAAREITAVQVEHVESPGHFYISFCESDELQALLDMMFEMRRFYTSPDVFEIYRLPRRFVRRGQACCMSEAGFWFYRVVIQRVVSASQVDVFYVDYGNTTRVDSDKLKFLKTCFSILPAQAVRSSLAGIKPKTGRWSPEATASFQSLCGNHVLAGALKCYAGDVLQVYLCDTRTSEDVYVHTVLLSQGHAVACGPSDSARCVEDNPFTLYLGDGAVDLQDVEKMTLDDLKDAATTKEKVDLDEMPALEPIVEEQVSAHFLV
ncbi:tudor domain-containing protein 5-like isoform X3 [Syngnathus scovelli]|uniref:tudor domain-containing protein 5-like isoform X3 n=1 Tax=Syngnathus scovelli TaxID=161590 RepID=UPI00210F3371|nr:tudor domain-containing protein 5-like isoform X3 [Syngnathus scovelli]XP_049588312.1 tudor domain-containing protein 5-like isoform X3 [Syngnathus scovelli]